MGFSFGFSLATSGGGLGGGASAGLAVSAGFSGGAGRSRQPAPTKHIAASAAAGSHRIEIRFLVIMSDLAFSRNAPSILPVSRGRSAQGKLVSLKQMSVRAWLVAAALTAPLAAATPDLLRARATSQLTQNRRADEEGLSRIQDLAMLRRFVRAELLVPVPPRTRYYYTRYIPGHYHYLRPWSKLFLDRLSRDYHARFGKRLRVTSMVRTAALQKQLARRNENAADAHGPRRSSHLTGATLDISKFGMSRQEIDWMRRRLHALKQQGCLYAVEEFSQPTFHIMVFRRYAEYKPVGQERASAGPAASRRLAPPQTRR